MKKLFEVTRGSVCYVMAESCEEAQRIAEDQYWRYCGEENGWEAYEARSYVSRWKNSIPYSSDDEKTVGQIFEEKLK
jgi:hypothetical protein